MALVDAVGTGAFLAVSVLFVTRTVHLSPAELGLGLTMSAAIALGTAVPIGVLADRIGPRQVLVRVSLWRCGCFVAYPFVRNLWQFLTVVCLLGLADKAAAPMEQALVGQAVTAAERIRVMAVLRAVRNVGLSAGAMLGGVGLLVDTRTGYAAILLANAASFAVLAALAGRLPLLTAPATGLRRRFSTSVFRDGPFLAFTAVSAVLTIHMTLLSMGLPLWIIGHSHVPPPVIAPLLVVNTVLAVAFQVRASRGTDTVVAASGALRRAGIALAACCLLLIAVPRLSTAPAVVLLLAAMVALTAGELWQSAGGWGASYLLAQPGQDGVYLSVFWLGVALQQIAAPVVLTQVEAAGTVGWLALGAVLAGSGLLAPAVGRWALARASARIEPVVVAAPERPGFNTSPAAVGRHRKERD